MYKAFRVKNNPMSITINYSKKNLNPPLRFDISLNSNQHTTSYKQIYNSIIFNIDRLSRGLSTTS